MIHIPHIKEETPIPPIPTTESGLADRSEELAERSEKDVRIRFYQSMASIDEARPGLAHTICEAVASVMYDFCAMHLRTRDGGLDLVAAHDVNEALRSGVKELVAVGRIIPADALERAANSGQMSSLEFDEAPSFVVGDGPDERPVSVHSIVVAPLKTTKGELFGAMSLGRHATTRRYDDVDRALLEWIASHVSMKLETARLHRDLKATNRQLSIKAEALGEAVRTRDIFLATASHELKTPLSTLALQVELIQRQLDSMESEVQSAIGRNVNSIERQVDRLSRLVSQLLDVSKLTEGQVRLDLEAIDLYDVAREVVERFQFEARRNDIEFILEGAPCEGVWDRSRLDQILSNLVSNAIKYGGSVVRVSVARQGTDARFEVCDDGQGIPDHARQRVFERFERAETRGSSTGFGLGLWIVRQLVERFDGAIDIRDGVDGGTCLRVVIPRNAGPVADPG